ncbi:MAG TPA: SUMF1/EgtB/PvdO family nonheme iron enzyme [Polyangiaceae bacterium]|nr:SUMF1/EgtB/PvdO family nonheme iron enzyme [Polyangiaceae bacterium]
MSSRETAIAAVSLAAALASIVATVVFALGDRQGPARCPEGLLAAGARCCGAGQPIVGGRCTGRPTHCAVTQTVTADGCVAPPDHVSLAGGKALVGSPDWQGHEARALAAGSVAPFELDAFEVTLSRWEPCRAAGACSAPPLAGEPGEPVRGVTPTQAEGFCRFAGGRLPTGAEWVLAAMGREARRFAWGSTGLVCRRAAYGLVKGPCAEDATGPELAGARPDGVTPDGAYDLSGNVAEWTREPRGFLARGGSFRATSAGELKNWTAEATDARPDIGFRCAYAPHAGAR